MANKPLLFLSHQKRFEVYILTKLLNVSLIFKILKYYLGSNKILSILTRKSCLEKFFLINLVLRKKINLVAALIFWYAHYRLNVFKSGYIRTQTIQITEKAPKTYAKTTLCARYSLAFLLLTDTMDNEESQDKSKK
jgi:hypothetical protein